MFMQINTTEVQNHMIKVKQVRETASLLKSLKQLKSMLIIATVALTGMIHFCLVKFRIGNINYLQ